MGFYPKHLRRRRFNSQMRTICRAALAGALFRRFYNHLAARGYRVRWSVSYPDGQMSYTLRSKHEAALVYLRWFWVYR